MFITKLTQFTNDINGHIIIWMIIIGKIVIEVKAQNRIDMKDSAFILIGIRQ